MSTALRIDTPGGANVGGNALRNIGQLSVGQSALPDPGFDTQLTGGTYADSLETALLEAAAIGPLLEAIITALGLSTEQVQDLIAAMLTSTGGTLTLTYDDVAGTLNIESIGAGDFDGGSATVPTGGSFDGGTA